MCCGVTKLLEEMRSKEKARILVGLLYVEMPRNHCMYIIYLIKIINDLVNTKIKPKTKLYLKEDDKFAPIWFA